MVHKSIKILVIEIVIDNCSLPSYGIRLNTYDVLLSSVRFNALSLEYIPLTKLLSSLYNPYVTTCDLVTIYI